MCQDDRIWGLAEYKAEALPLERTSRRC